MVGGQLVVDELAGLAVALERVVAAVVLGQLLLDDVGLDRDADVVGLAGEVGGHVVVDAVLLERAVAQVAPQHREHAELVGLGEGLGDLLDLAGGLVGAEVDRGADAGRAEVVGLLDRAEHDLVELVRVRQQLVVVELHDERDAVGVARGTPRRARRRSWPPRCSRPRWPARRCCPGRSTSGSGRTTPRAECSMPWSTGRIDT